MSEQSVREIQTPRGRPPVCHQCPGREIHYRQFCPLYAGRAPSDAPMAKKKWRPDSEFQHVRACMMCGQVAEEVKVARCTRCGGSLLWQYS